MSSSHRARLVALFLTVGGLLISLHSLGTAKTSVTQLTSAWQTIPVMKADLQILPTIWGMSLDHVLLVLFGLIYGARRLIQSAPAGTPSNSSGLKSKMDSGNRRVAERRPATG